ncbi:hypothetical protein BD626DRAFT_398924 [Schizophyllum amplum]|uniref:DUF6593 domain-containing protein n=1 Tax=Schizophyllum amplum TaxID=97359 RepID=A0A550CLC4_9AGAR|nr:hypothetical protein BD626DRAFT_398924 [Auriculariopsis ampla]
MTKFGFSFFLEDKTGRLTGSEFVDVYDRMRFVLRRTVHEPSHSAYIIYNAATSKPVAALDYGPHNALGSISFSSTNTMPMKKYLTKATGHQSRKFVASDGQEYIWSYRQQADQEWTCTNTSGYLIAYYSLKTPGEPDYPGSSGCTLTIEEPFGHLAAEMLVSLLIMRHIAAHNL